MAHAHQRNAQYNGQMAASHAAPCAILSRPVRVLAGEYINTAQRKGACQVGRGAGAVRAGVQ